MLSPDQKNLNIKSLEDFDLSIFDDYKKNISNFLSEIQNKIIFKLPNDVKFAINLYEKNQKKRTYSTKYLNSLKKKFSILFEDFILKLKEKISDQKNEEENEDFSKEIIDYIKSGLKEKIEKIHKNFFNKKSGNNDNKFIKILERIIYIYKFFDKSHIDLNKKFSVDYQKLVEIFKEEYIKKGNLKNVKDLEKIIKINSNNYKEDITKKSLFLRSKESVLNEICLLLKSNSTEFRDLNILKYLNL